MLILLESATENSCREFLEYYEGSLILDWKDFRLVSSASMANLSSLLVTSFSSLRFLSNSLSSPRFRVARRCFSWSSVSDDLFFPSSVVFFGSLSCSIFFASNPQHFFPLFFSLLSSVCFKFLISK